jgi:uncharacterized protein
MRERGDTSLPGNPSPPDNRSSLSDRLKALGVKVGAQGLPAPSKRRAPALDAVLEGHTLQTPQGETFVAEQYFPAGYHHGRYSLLPEAPLQVLGAWAGDARIAELPPGAFAFLDTETSGLAGGTGTYAFLVGVARFETDAQGELQLHLAQFFMRDPSEELALLSGLEQFLAPCQALVTFNGKAFDAPLLTTRYILQGWRPPFHGFAHIDLLPLARRLWRSRLPSRTLGNLEVQILGTQRSGEDIPGWLIPSLYFDYLRSGDATPLRGVLYHNAMDVVSLAALLNHTGQMLADPFSGAVDEAVDIIALAKLYEDLGELEMATRLYLHGLAHDLPRPVLLEAIQQLALIHKHAANHDAAVSLWKSAAAHQHIDSHIELAMYYEHQQKDINAALEWTEAAIHLLQLPAYIALRYTLLPELEHRRQRLLRKLGTA